ncbi:hypothetical protein NHX12_014254 [Muraenolepis orangiensis]|uniref:Uncharacterized protein n=1 Tax=Muraenolepis orangiensis TaxID=630683 RepID=A0A9Q0I515_9TELE|nr:hypothetical protein NHX12_014254 [Muraenolepis orangiensis]
MDPDPEPVPVPFWDGVDSLDLGGVPALPSAFFVSGDMEVGLIHQPQTPASRCVDTTGLSEGSIAVTNARHNPERFQTRPPLCGV